MKNNKKNNIKKKSNHLKGKFKHKKKNIHKY